MYIFLISPVCNLHGMKYSFLSVGCVSYLRICCRGRLGEMKPKVPSYQPLSVIIVELKGSIFKLVRAGLGQDKVLLVE